MTKILIKRLSKNIPLPKYETTDSSGMDLSANIQNPIKIQPGKTSIIPTGISLSLPKNFEIQIRPRSGLAARNQITVLNTPGTIDADYRGEIKVILINLGNEDFIVEKRSRIAQFTKLTRASSLITNEAIKNLIGRVKSNQILDKMKKIVLSYNKKAA